MLLRRVVVGLLALALACGPVLATTALPPVTGTGLPVTLPSGVATTVDAALGRVARPLTRMTWLSDSRGCFSQYAPTGAGAGFGKHVQDALTWVEAYSGGALVYDQPDGPPGVYNTIIALRVVSGGSGYTAPTISIPAASGFAATAIVQGGVITGATVTATGAAPGSSVTSAGITITDSTGSGAVLTPVLGGHGSYCAGGTTLPEIKARLPDIINRTWAPRPDILFVFGGHNDLLAIGSGPVSVRTMLGNAMGIIQQATSAGMLVVWMAETPASDNGLSATLTTSALRNQYRQQLEQYNAGLRLMAGLDPTLNPSGAQFLLVDASRYMMDGSSGSSGGQAAPYRLGDGTHPAQWGAMQIGRKAEIAVRPYYNISIVPGTYSPLPFDAVNNKGGSLIPTFTGTGGTNSISGITGTVPNSWTLFRASGTGTLSGTSTVTNATGTSPNSDGTIISSWNINFTATNNGAVGDYLQAQWSTAPGTNISAGDSIRASCEVSWSGFQNVNRVNLNLTDNVLNAGYGQNTGVYFPPGTDGYVGAVPAPDAVQPFRLITPILPLTAASVTANQIKLQFQIGYDASTTPNSIANFGASAGAAANVTLRNCQINKVGQGLIP